MSAAPVSAALLGSGLFASNSYLPALLNVPGLSVGTIWSRSEKSASGLAAKAAELGGLPNAGTPVIQFGDDGLAAVLADESIKAVISVLPIGVQPGLIRKCWAAGKHVISEKPLGRDVKEALALIEEYEKEWKPKGLVWRVAENYAHEPLLHYAADLLAQKEMGSVLYWRMHMETMLPDGSSYHGTSWRTVPDYQGGFLLDGGVHWAALLRTVLPGSAVPADIIAHKSLHRAHMLPHDTLVGVCRPAKNTERDPHGNPTRVEAARQAAEMPTPAGRSAAHGTFVLSWAIPDTPRNSRLPNELYVAAENGTLQIVNHGRAWTVTLVPAEGAAVAPATKEGKVTGVERELADYAAAVAAHLAGVVDENKNYGDPRLALWDLAFIQAGLESDGVAVDIAETAEGK